MADEDKDKAEKVAAAKKRVCLNRAIYTSQQMLTLLPVRATEETESKGEQKGRQQEEGRQACRRRCTSRSVYRRCYQSG